MLERLPERRYHGDEVAWAFVRVVSPLVQRSSDNCISAFSTCAKALEFLREMLLQGDIDAWTFAEPSTTLLPSLPPEFQAQVVDCLV
jgi:hypothetical protein